MCTAVSNHYPCAPFSPPRRVWHCAACDVWVPKREGDWEVHCRGIRHQRQLLSLRVTGQRGKLVLSAFESAPGELRVKPSCVCFCGPGVGSLWEGRLACRWGFLGCRLPLGRLEEVARVAMWKGLAGVHQLQQCSADLGREEMHRRTGASRVPPLLFLLMCILCSMYKVQNNSNNNNRKAELCSSGGVPTYCPSCWCAGPSDPAYRLVGSKGAAQFGLAGAAPSGSGTGPLRSLPAQQQQAVKRLHTQALAQLLNLFGVGQSE